jgi:hypothetical protein
MVGGERQLHKVEVELFRRLAAAMGYSDEYFADSAGRRYR